MCRRKSNDSTLLFDLETEVFAGNCPTEPLDEYGVLLRKPTRSIATGSRLRGTSLITPVRTRSFSYQIVKYLSRST